MTASDIVSALNLHYRHRGSYRGRSIAVFSELRVGTGYGADNQQRLDYFAISLWPSEHIARTCYEIKVSRSDFLAEMRKTAKRKRALLLSNYFYFAAPQGLIRPSELPPEAGLVEVVDGELVTRVTAPWRDTVPPPWFFLAAIARLAQERGDQIAEMQGVTL